MRTPGQRRPRCHRPGMLLIDRMPPTCDRASTILACAVHYETLHTLCQAPPAGPTVPGPAVDRSESAAVHTAAPNRIRSFSRKPCVSGDNPGVVNRKLKVMMNWMLAATLPTNDTCGHQWR